MIAWIVRGCIVGPLVALATDSAPAAGPERYLNRDAAWYATAEAKQIAENILSYQATAGGWPKNTDTVSKPYEGDRARLVGTFDNSATTDELRFLALCYRAINDDRYQAAFIRGLDYILKAQYANGGWPQFYPPSARTPYQRYITFNDNAIVRLMEFLRQVSRDEIYQFVDAQRRQNAREAFDRGIDCILKCQIIIDGRRTAWCAQHDEVEFAPRPARSYELASLSGSETVGIARLLMSLDEPSPEVVRAVDAAVAWLETAKLPGIRLERQPDPKSPSGFDRVVIADPNAPPMWARFYEMKSNRPIFCDRDGVPKATLAEIGYERRNGYSWLGDWPQKLLETEYPAWKSKLATEAKGGGQK